jgi:predicted transposase/invertase (TIGR01784 family)
VNFEFFPTGDFHTSFHLREDRDKELILTEALEIHFVDMVKFKAIRKKDIRNDPLRRRPAWFDQDSPLGLVEEAVKMDSAIRKAEARMEYITKDKDALRAYEMRQMALSDWTSGINYARREGRKEGIEEGRVEEKLAIARTALARGFTVEDVRNITGLDPDTIKSLQD